jgi:prevent-host-death family protein
MLVNMHEAKTQLSRLVERAAAGEEVVIAKAGKPVAKLIAFDDQPRQRLLGGWKGKFWLADDWDSPETNKEIEKLFYESEIFPEDDA